MAHITRSTSSIISVNGDASSSARLIDIYGAMSRVDVGSGRCTVVTAHDDHWTEATVDAQSLSGAIGFRSATSQADGSVEAHAESWSGELVKVSKVRIAANGEWRSETEHHHQDGLLARTTAKGALSALGDGVSLQRVRFDDNGTQLWTATAKVIHDQYGPGRTTRWTTTGNINFSSGGRGTFSTVSTAKGLNGSGTWKTTPTGLTANGLITKTVDGNGGEKTTITVNFGDGSQQIRNIISKTTQGPGASGTSELGTTVTTYGNDHQQVSTSASRDYETIGADGSAQWEKSHTDANGKTETDSGTYTKGAEGTESVTTSHVNKDGSGSITTTTWGDDGVATRRTTEYGPDGTVTRDDTTTGTIEPTNYARYPGDAGDGFFKPDPDGSSGEDHPARDDHPSGEEDHPDHPDDGEGAASAEYGDGDMGSDTGGGTPGLGWDGGGEGPLGLLPDHGAGVLTGGTEGIDSTGQDTVSGLIGQALKHVVAQGGSGSGTSPGDSGFGEDVTGSSGVVIAGSGIGHVGLASTDGEWGDFTDPKATLDFAQEVVTSIAHSGHTSAIQTAGVVSAVGSVGARIARVRTKFGR